MPAASVPVSAPGLGEAMVEASAVCISVHGRPSCVPAHVHTPVTTMNTGYHTIT